MNNTEITKGERKSAIVVIISAITMALEIATGYWAGSMALIANGFHMCTHVLVIGLNWIAYVIIRNMHAKGKEVDDDNMLALAGFASGLLLTVSAAFIMVEAIERISEPEAHGMFAEAMAVAWVGMVVNAGSAWVLHTGRRQGDYNNRAAYLHVLSDVLTNAGIVLGLICAHCWNITWVDTAVAVICAAIVLRWAVLLIIKTSKVLMTR